MNRKIATSKKTEKRAQKIATSKKTEPRGANILIFVEVVKHCSNFSVLVVIVCHKFLDKKGFNFFGKKVEQKSSRRKVTD